jgi:DNA-binding NtrC family response regulator
MILDPVQILIIDDNFSEVDPLVITLKEKYGEDNVTVKQKSSEGLRFILQNLTQKLIVLLDLDLGPGEPHGVEVFQKVRYETSLVYIIIMTAKSLNTIPSEDLIKFINNDVLQLINNTIDISEIVDIVDKAAHELDVRVDCVLEQWISKRSKEEREKPFMLTQSGRKLTLDDIIIEIRKETDIGKRLEKSIIQLAIDLLTKGKERVND